jgi:hypothetical protein
VKHKRSFLDILKNKPQPPNRAEVASVLQREVAEATRQRLVRAMDQRQRDVNELFDAILPKREAK